MIKDILEQYAKLGAGYYQYLLSEGREWSAQALPSQFAPGPKKACFKNAALLALGDSSLTYVEGMAFGVIPTAHAWVVDPEGLVIDTTWDTPENCQYFGWAFQTSYLKKTVLRSKIWGLAAEHLPPIFARNPGLALHPKWHPNPTRLKLQGMARA